MAGLFSPLRLGAMIRRLSEQRPGRHRPHAVIPVVFKIRAKELRL